MPEADDVICPDCGIRIPESALGGMCPCCLLGMAEDSNAVESPASKKKGSARFAPTLEELATHFPDLEILELLGSGGMGTVYQARQPRLERLVALKVLCCEPELHEPFSLRFEQEAQLLARLKHPNIVDLYDFGEIEDGPNGLPLFYFLMEYVDGTDLETRLRDGRLPVEEGLPLMEQVCDALAYAHDEGVIHRDIKPANLLLDSAGTVKVADFGVAKIVNEDETTALAGLTLTGSTMGTPFYMAPEILDGRDSADHRSDLYSAGIVLLQLLTGERPGGILSLPSTDSDLPKCLDAPVARALEKEPSKRIGSAEALGELIRTAKVRYQKSHRRRKALPLGLIMAAMIALAAVSAKTLLPGAATSEGDGSSNQPDEAAITPIPPPPANSSEFATPGRLVAFRASPDQEAIDLTRAEPFADFVQVYQSERIWIALRKNGDTVSSSAHAERSGIARICPGFYGCFALVDRTGTPELLTDTGIKHSLQAAMPAEVTGIGVREIFVDQYRALAWLNDGTARAWGEAYDQPEMIPDWTSYRGTWRRPPAEALQQVISIGMGFSWDGTVTADGRLWIWGRDGLIPLGEAEAHQGNFDRLSFFAADRIEAQLKDGRVANIHQQTKKLWLTPFAETSSPLFHIGKFRLTQSPGGRWHSADEIPLHRNLLDRITGWPKESFSLSLSPWNPNAVNPGAVGRLILIVPDNDPKAIP